MQSTGTRPKVVVSGGARGVVGHAGTRLLTDLADKTGLTSGFVQALGLDRVRRPAHEPGRVAVDLAVLLADGGEATADLAVLRQQPALFGPVASDPTAWRVLDTIDTAGLARLRAARAAARELAWAQLLETRRSLPVTTVLGRALPGFVLDIDATIVLTHSEKESAAATWKHSFGYHPLLCFLDATGEALAAMLRPGNAGSNTAADHITVLGQALQQIPEQHRYGSPILIRSDSAGSSYEFLAHIRGLREQGVHTEFSVGVAITTPVRAAITAAQDWVAALDGDGSLRDGAELVELTDHVDRAVLASFPAGTRLICRRERPHPGAQLSLFDQVNGMRRQVFATDGGGAVVAAKTAAWGKSCISGISKLVTSDDVKRLEACKTTRHLRRIGAEAAHEHLSGLLTDPSPAAVHAALLALGTVPGGSVYRRDAWYTVLNALRMTSAGGRSVAETVVQYRNRTRATGRRDGRHMVSRPMLIKGLECDHAVILDAGQHDPTSLYVALTRARKSLTVISAGPQLSTAPAKAGPREMKPAHPADPQPCQQTVSVADRDNQTVTAVLLLRQPKADLMAEPCFRSTRHATRESPYLPLRSIPGLMALEGGCRRRAPTSFPRPLPSMSMTLLQPRSSVFPPGTPHARQGHNQLQQATKLTVPYPDR